MIDARRRPGRRSRSATAWRPPSSRSASKPHIVVDGKACADCSTRDVHRRLPRQPVRADERRRHPLQLRAVLRMRHVLPGLQPRGRDHLVVSRGRIRRRLPEQLMIAVCIKWVGASSAAGCPLPTRPRSRWRCATARRLAVPVIAVTVGGIGRRPRPAQRAGVRSRRRPSASTRPTAWTAQSVAAALAPVVAHSTAVWCGDYSSRPRHRQRSRIPRRTAAPQQALGLVGVEFIDPLRVIRRLDGGRREMLRVTGPAVLSVEGSVARLRRAPLRAALAAQTAEVLPYGTTSVPTGNTSVVAIRPYRPRARVLPAPIGDDPARPPACPHRRFRRAAAGRDRRGRPRRRGAADHRGASRLGLPRLTAASQLHRDRGRLGLAGQPAHGDHRADQHDGGRDPRTGAEARR